MQWKLGNVLIHIENWIWIMNHAHINEIMVFTLFITQTIFENQKRYIDFTILVI